MKASTILSTLTFAITAHSAAVCIGTSDNVSQASTDARSTKNKQEHMLIVRHASMMISRSALLPSFFPSWARKSEPTMA